MAYLVGKVVVLCGKVVAFPQFPPELWKGANAGKPVLCKKGAVLRQLFPEASPVVGEVPRSGGGVGLLRGRRENGCLPLSCSFLASKRNRKTATVSMRWTPTRV